MFTGTRRLHDPVLPRNLMRDDAAGGAELRAELRRFGGGRATMFHAGLAIAVQVLNTSRRGAMIAMPSPPSAGTQLVIAINGGEPVFATVRWSDGERAGLALETGSKL